MTDPATLKNDTQRKAWLADYRSWGRWYADENISASYYRYDFRNGAAIIVDEYVVEGNKYCPAHTHAWFHLVGGPKPKRLVWDWHQWYDRRDDSVTFLVNFLKETKGGTV